MRFFPRIFSNGFSLISGLVNLTSYFPIYLKRSMYACFSSYLPCCAPSSRLARYHIIFPSFAMRGVGEWNFSFHIELFYFTHFIYLIYNVFLSKDLFCDGKLLTLWSLESRSPCKERQKGCSYLLGKFNHVFDGIKSSSSQDFYICNFHNDMLQNYQNIIGKKY